MKFDVLAVPLTFGVKHGDVLLAKVTVDAAHTITLAPLEGVDAEEIAKLRQDVEVHAASDSAQYKFSDRGADGTHHSCGDAVKKGTPQYPAALKAAIYSDYYEVVDTAE